MHNQIGIAQLLQRGFERLDQMVLGKGAKKK